MCGFCSTYSSWSRKSTSVKLSNGHSLTSMIISHASIWSKESSASWTCLMKNARFSKHCHMLLNFVEFLWMLLHFDLTDECVSDVIHKKFVCGQTICFVLDRIMFVRRSVAVVFWECNFDLAKIWFLVQDVIVSLSVLLCSVCSFSGPVVVEWQYIVIFISIV